LGYGPPRGPADLRERIAERIARQEGYAASPDDVLVSGGNSQGLDLALTMLTGPGDIVLVESPTYALALQMLRDRPLEVAAVPMDANGIDVERLEGMVEALAAAGRKPRLLYTIPTFHNPTGVSLSPERRRVILELARRHALILIEDDAYREIAYEAAAPASLWATDPEAPVVRLGSFSKSLAPGLRVGWINARADLLERISAAGLLESGGCVTQFAASVVARALSGPGYDDHLHALRRSYASRRTALTAALRAHLPAGARFVEPAGGFFIWLTLPEGVTSARLLPVAEEHGVSFASGSRFSTDGDDGSVRLAFALLDEQTLAEGARRLGLALRNMPSPAH
jgi:DNA-binding transcriptional MocR family regulator